ncbi:protein DpdE [Azospirillum isscasi]|uniref:Protein DpdE n=1 Tax=Azospirillum isscasi TaxID=3053926 RepID=A0ABU0WDC0_9PROT|nr:protein DpdE [Azospirillum isscasi]MDQ2102192.1 protein DpdE [Azospirillum isscasi]
MFVKARIGENASLGIGKLIHQHGQSCTVEYFDAPFADGILHTYHTSEIEPFTLPGQTRLYYFNPRTGAWEIGRLLEDLEDRLHVRFPNGSDRLLPASEVFVRWARPITDPTPFLASRINETPHFADGRSGFVRSIMAQRAVTMGMSALASSAVELEAHQIEVVRRVLQDPVQRYLLADEVGLGKTVEAGVLIRQCVLDFGGHGMIVVIVPDALEAQWRTELVSKFFLGHCLDKLIHVLPLSGHERIKSLLRGASMLVIDEAHHLTGKPAGPEGALYADVAAAAPDIERVLLLSATPAIHNERGFLEILHLLDPDTYPLGDEAGLRRRIENRQVLAGIVAGLAPENVLYLDPTLDELTALFADDRLLQEHVTALREIANRLPSEDDPDLVAAIGRVRAHVGEIYRLHRRILRHRRRTIVGLTPGRSGATRIEYGCPATARACEAAEAWRFDESTAADDSGAHVERGTAFLQVLDRIAEYACSGGGTVGGLARRADLVGDIERFATINRRLSGREAFDARADALVEALKKNLRPKQQFVVFCSESETANALAALLHKRLGVPVDRHDPDKEDWLAFNSDTGRPLLVCDRRAEEGLNLQGGRKTVVHYDLPLNPNRVEQRLGRADRYGSGDAVRSLVLVCRDNPFETAWVDYLDRALRVFDRSVASLQYLIEETTRGLCGALFREGAEAVTDLTQSSAGEDGTIEREIRNLDQQDALDALGAPPVDTLDALAEVDDDWRELDHAASAWIEFNLQFSRVDGQADMGRSGAEADPFSYRYITHQPHTLVPLETFYERCATSIDKAAMGKRGRVLKTVPLTYRRKTALSREGRAAHARLLRYGDPFITGMWNLTQDDDRGRSTAFWRFFPGLRTEGTAHLYFRFDFIVEPDLTCARAVLAGAGKLSDSAQAAIKRRGDMALPPTFQTIWLDQELEPVTDEADLARLVLPYRPEAQPQGGRDYNLNPSRWRNIAQLGLPQLTDWPATCQAARRRAEEVLGDLPTFRDLIKGALLRSNRVDQERLGHLHARADRRGLPTDQADWALERDLSAALSQGIASPSIMVDAVVASFVCGDAAATATVDGRD